MFPMAYIKQKCKKTKLASTLWYNTYKYTAYVKKKKKSENSESVRYSVVSNCLQPMIVACQAILSMEFSRQEY